MDVPGRHTNDALVCYGNFLAASAVEQRRTADFSSTRGIFRKARALRHGVHDRRVNDDSVPPAGDRHWPRGVEMDSVGPSIQTTEAR
jgi:hypothetical protein